MGRKLKRALWGSVALLGTSFAVMGFLHTKWGRPLLAKTGGCPVGGDAHPVGDVQKATFAAIRGNAGTTVAPARPALGFKLDESTLDEGRAWVKLHALNCEEIRERTVIRCFKVPAAALPESMGAKSQIDELVLGYRLLDQKLYSVDTFRLNLDAASALEQASAVSANLKNVLGSPAQEAGALDSETVANAVYMMEYKFSDLVVRYNTARIPSGISMREQYISAKNPS